MTINFYKNSAENNRLDKTEYLEFVTSMAGYLRENTSIINPVIVVQTTGLLSFNYAYIPEFNRYYFVNDIVAIQNALWEISFICDVLMTYKTELLSLDAIIARNENIYDLTIEDNRRKKRETLSISIIETSTEDFFGDYGVTDDRIIVSHLDNNDGSTLVVKDPRSFITNRKTMFYATNLRTFLAAINTSEFKTAMENLFANNPLEGILSIRLYPFSLTKFFNGTGVYHDDNINLGAYTIDLASVGGCYDCSQACDSINTKDVALFDFTQGTNIDWRDFYVSYSLYLPFYGFVELNASDIIGYYLKITYAFDFDQGSADIHLYRSKTNLTSSEWELFSIVSCNIAINIPYSANNTNERLRDNIFSTLANGLSIAGSVIAAPATSGFSLMGIPSILGSTVQNIVGNSVPKYSNRSISSGPAPFLQAPNKPYIIAKKPNWVEPSNYNSLNGLPYYNYARLSTLSGYTEISEIHLEGFAAATSNEIDTLDRILKEGFII